MCPKFRTYLLPILFFLLIAGGVFAGLSHAQPGTEDDPVVSLSWLESALALSPIALEGGEELNVTGGRGIALLDGRCRLTSRDGGVCWILNVSSGEVIDAPVDMVEGNLYIPISEDGESVQFTILAWQSSTLAIPGGLGR